MENPGYIALSRQMALRTNMDIIAHNLANMNTPAFRGEGLMFSEYLDKVEGGEKISMVQDLSILRDLRPGQMTTTQNPLDLAISGNGYFAIETEFGERYTRNGVFQLNGDGELVTSQGHIVQGDVGGAIVIPPDAGTITIAKDGTISTEDGQIGKLRLVSFENEQMLQRLANGLHDPMGEQPVDAEDAEIIQGMIEGSNVAGVVEMTKMMAVMRSYQSASRFAEQEHERQRRAIQDLGNTRL